MVIGRVLSGNRGRYGAEASQDFTPYENFQKKSRSVLLLINSLFLFDLTSKRKDQAIPDFR
ncbi:hypothetical protein AF99_22905 [Salmonella enterica subsp. enterica]|nr:hypothetical protein [Salmonella enterica]ECJ3906173.1 hypothetical protein [Salmonella enterica subsp. enterica serovar Poona]